MMGRREDSWRVSRLVLYGRRASLAKDFDKALEYFRRAAEKAPAYQYRSMDFCASVWTFLGRTQYGAGHVAEARLSLERALIENKEDHLARIYWGLTLLRQGHRTRALSELTAGLRGLFAWLEDVERRRPFEVYWDPNRLLRGEIAMLISLIESGSDETAQIIAGVEWVGAE